MNNIHINDSFAVSKHSFKAVLATYDDDDARAVRAKRSDFSLLTEWAAHNALYNLGIARERTKDVDLQIPQKWYEKIGYPVIGCLVWIFIK